MNGKPIYGKLPTPVVIGGITREVVKYGIKSFPFLNTNTMAGDNTTRKTQQSS